MVSHGRRRNRPAGAGPHAGDAARRDQRRGLIEIADDGERQAIDNKTGIELHWLPRNSVPAGLDDRLARAIRSVAWPTGSAFGWFAAEAAAARTVREHWRGTLTLGRNETLAAAYWRRGAAGLMAG
ncbi:siderophore-interacting protein [Mesorhizobium sp. C420B]